MAKTHVPRIIAPRLFGGVKRENYGGRLPPHVKDGLRLIAKQENKSMSWVMEEVIIRYFKMRTPKYIKKVDK